MICRGCKNGQHEQCDDLAREFRFNVWRSELRAGVETLAERVEHRRLIDANTPKRGCPCHHGVM